jgi:hypothetical protein
LSLRPKTKLDELISFWFIIVETYLTESTNHTAQFPTNNFLKIFQFAAAYLCETVLTRHAARKNAAEEHGMEVLFSRIAITSFKGLVICKQTYPLHNVSIIYISCAIDFS